MCGRFTLQIPPELLAGIFGLAAIPVVPAILTPFFIRPGFVP